MHSTTSTVYYKVLPITAQWSNRSLESVKREDGKAAVCEAR